MKIVDWKPIQDFRDKRAADILKVLADSGAIEAFRNKNKVLYVIDLGSGQGEIPLAVAKETGCFFICVDKFSDLSEKVGKEAAGKILWRREDAIEYLRRIESNSAPVISAFYFLQVLSPAEQVRLLWEICRVIKSGGKVILIDEYKRGRLGQMVDILMNKFLNAFNKQEYKIYSEKTWDNIFGIIGEFPIPKISYKFGRNSKLFAFQF